MPLEVNRSHEWRFVCADARMLGGGQRQLAAWKRDDPSIPLRAGGLSGEEGRPGGIGLRLVGCDRQTPDLQVAQRVGSVDSPLAEVGQTLVIPLVPLQKEWAPLRPSQERGALPADLTSVRPNAPAPLWLPHVKAPLPQFLDGLGDVRHCYGECESAPATGQQAPGIAKIVGGPSACKPLVMQGDCFNIGEPEVAQGVMASPVYVVASDDQAKPGSLV